MNKTQQLTRSAGFFFYVQGVAAEQKKGVHQ